MNRLDDLSDQNRRDAGFVGLGAQIEEVERELKFRRDLYPRWVRQGKMRGSIADEHIKRMEAVLMTLETLQRGHAD